MRTPWLLALLLAALTPACAQAACFPERVDYSPAAEYGRSDWVMVVTPTAERRIPDPEDVEAGGWLATVFTVTPERLIKGAPRKELDIYSRNDSSRFPMDLGKRYLVFVQREAGDGRLTVSSCGASDELDQAGDALARVEDLAGRKP